MLLRSSSIWKRTAKSMGFELCDETCKVLKQRFVTGVIEVCTSCVPWSHSQGRSNYQSPRFLLPLTWQVCAEDPRLWRIITNLKTRRKRRTRSRLVFTTFYDNRNQQHAIAPVGVACVYTCCQDRAPALTINTSSQHDTDINWLLTILLCCSLSCKVRKNQVELVTLLPQL